MASWQTRQRYWFGLAQAGIFALLCQLAAGTVTAAGTAAGTTTAGKVRPLEVAATLPLVAEWVQVVGGDGVKVHVLSPANADPHSFEPSARGIAAARRAQAVFALGLGLEQWVDRVERADTTLNVVRIAPTQGLRQMSQGTACNHDHGAHDHSTHNHADHDTDAAHNHGGESDPHVWLDPVLVQAMVQNIATELSRLQPANADSFAANAQRYCEQLQALDAQIRSELATVPAGRRKLLSNHDSLHYFASRYGFEIVATLFGTQGTEGGQPSARKVRELVGIIRAEGITAVFADASSNQSLLNAVTKEAAIAPPVVLYPMPAGKGTPAEDYLGMMRFNAAAIASALGDGGVAAQRQQ